MSGLPPPTLIVAVDGERVAELRLLVEEANAEADPVARARLIERIRELRATLASAGLCEGGK